MGAENNLKMNAGKEVDAVKERVCSSSTSAELDIANAQGMNLWCCMDGIKSTLSSNTAVCLRSNLFEVNNLSYADSWISFQIELCETPAQRAHTGQSPLAIRSRCLHWICALLHGLKGCIDGPRGRGSRMLQPGSAPSVDAHHAGSCFHPTYNHTP